MPAIVHGSLVMCINVVLVQDALLGAVPQDRSTVRQVPATGGGGRGGGGG